MKSSNAGEKHINNNLKIMSFSNTLNEGEYLGNFTLNEILNIQ
jgi:hypothetical protein